MVSNARHTAICAQGFWNQQKGMSTILTRFRRVPLGREHRCTRLFERVGALFSWNEAFVLSWVHKGEMTPIFPSISLVDTSFQSLRSIFRDKCAQQTINPKQGSPLLLTPWRLAHLIHLFLIEGVVVGIIAVVVGLPLCLSPGSKVTVALFEGRMIAVAPRSLSLPNCLQCVAVVGVFATFTRVFASLLCSIQLCELLLKEGDLHLHIIFFAFRRSFASGFERQGRGWCSWIQAVLVWLYKSGTALGSVAAPCLLCFADFPGIIGRYLLPSARHDILNGVIPMDDDFLHVGFFNLGRYLARSHRLCLLIELPLCHMMCLVNSRLHVTHNSADVLNSGHHGLIWCSRFG
mmetsp:Transcript_117029/g.164491  ORF Transcript_117029/g.164491 Transcript_117029/m.164491 type:complete len:348 (-) Transcript_117029:272-1315(-)